MKHPGPPRGGPGRTNKEEAATLLPYTVVAGSASSANNPTCQAGADSIESDEIKAELRQCRALLPLEIDEIATRHTIPVTALTDFFSARVAFLDGAWFEFDRYVRDPSACTSAY